jgi:hypothetical protein
VRLINAVIDEQHIFRELPKHYRGAFDSQMDGVSLSLFGVQTYQAKNPQGQKTIPLGLPLYQHSSLRTKLIHLLQQAQ